MREPHTIIDKNPIRQGTFVSYILGFPNLEVSTTLSLLDLFFESSRRNALRKNICFPLENGKKQQAIPDNDIVKPCHLQKRSDAYMALSLS